MSAPTERLNPQGSVHGGETAGLRLALATRRLAHGYDIRTVQELLGHKGVRTTMIYTHVFSCGGRGVRSPVDGL